MSAAEENSELQTAAAGIHSDDESSSSSSLSSPGGAAGNQYIRKTVLAINDRASDLISTSTVAKFTLNSVGRLVEPVLQYADPILTSIDDRIDAIVAAIRTMSVSHPQIDRTQYWSRLKQTFLSSQWFVNVESILTPTGADAFYTTATKCFMDVGNVSCEVFIETLQERLGDTWDPRLLNLAKVFYATASTAAAIVGLGRFFRGAFGLGRSKLNTALEQIIDKWDRVLGATDTAVDRWLPETGLAPGGGGADDWAHFWHAGASGKGTPDAQLSGGKEAHGSSTGDETASPDDDTDSIAGISRNKRRSVSAIASTVTRRVRQRMSQGLRDKLHDSKWFTNVDEILSQNVVLQSLGDLSKPADHFFDTAAGLVCSSGSSDEFITSMQLALGAAWDDRLTQPSLEFYEASRA